MTGRKITDALRRSAPGGWRRDLTPAAILTVFFFLASGHNRPPAGGHALDALGYVTMVLGGVSIALCRRFPRTAVILVVAALSCYVGRSYPDGPVYLAGIYVLFSLGWHTPRRTSLSGAALLLVALTAAALATQQHLTVLPLVFAGWAAAAVLLGEALRNRRAYLDGVRERTRSDEQTRVEQGRRRIAEERLRIARDLHDSVGHAMAMINVQAAAGAHVADQRPEAAKQALVAIQQASGDVLDELTSMLNVLRADGEAAERMPMPGIAEIRQLVAGSGNARLRTSIVVEGRTEDVPEAVGTAAYRIVQESLTNVIRHAGAASVQVTVHAEEDRGLRVEIRDDGAGAASPAASCGSGIGIRGMRERAESTGGQLEAGPAPRGGFVVRADWRPRS
ncbi:sensor histidine kinase [Actinospica sp.]|uniref:sensor histidine kinase n=1 Tax=Actinospica sp. TaxID=1872142 RepID=UPI002BDFD7ED|nr:sensor histidine kinase [Actinospica sp.]HWG27043.1 sensor histidine kinase [Actinospica sp.]